MPNRDDVPRQWARAPIGEGSEQWRTIPFERTILVVARGPTTTLWVFDFLDEILADPRIQVVFTIDEDEPDTFSRGLTDITSIADAAVIPWSQARKHRFDLAITASFEGSLHQLKCPLLLGLHGGSICKQDAVPAGGHFAMPSLLGAPPQAAATTVMLSHPDQQELFPWDQPSVEVAVAGDPCLDRLEASRPLRDHYRRDLGLDAHQRLVVVCSTWGPDTVLAAIPDIGIRLASELPTDSYRVAMIVHPNIWTAHGFWQVHTWSKRATEAGVLAIPPSGNAWRSALVASDAVIHDHGSVGLYAAALDLPMMNVGLDPANMIDSAPIAHLGRLTPRIDLSAPLRPQIDSAIRDHTPGRYEPIAQRVSSRPGEALRLHRDLIYRLIGLDTPAFEPRTLAMPPPPEPLPAIYSHRVYTSVESTESTVVDRFPASPPPPPPQHTQPDPGRNVTLSAMSASPTPDFRPTRPSCSIRRKFIPPNNCYSDIPAAGSRSPRTRDRTPSCSGSRTAAASGCARAAHQRAWNQACSRPRSTPSRPPATT